MSILLRQPAELDLRAGQNLKKSWNTFIKAWYNYAIASGLNNEHDEKKVAAFLHIIGPDAVKKYDSFKWENNNDCRLLHKVIDKFEKHFIPRNTIIERQNFLSRKQRPGETCEQFVKQLKMLAATCKYGNDDEMVRDQLILNISYNFRDKVIDHVLEATDNIKLETIMMVIKTYEIKYISKGNVSKKNDDKSDFIHCKFCSNYHQKYKCPAYRKKFENNMHDKVPEDFSKKTDDKANIVKNCDYCSSDHKRKRCPAFGKTCNKCGKLNHFENSCKNVKMEVDAISSTHSFPSGQIKLSKKPDDKPNIVVNCNFCSNNHEKNRCPAFGKTCNSCGKLNHLENSCKNYKTNVDSISSQRSFPHGQFKPSNSFNDDTSCKKFVNIDECDILSSKCFETTPTRSASLTDNKFLQPPQTNNKSEIFNHTKLNQRKQKDDCVIS